jgi:hypothetical protein
MRPHHPCSSLAPSLQKNKKEKRKKKKEKRKKKEKSTNMEKK